MTQKDAKELTLELCRYLAEHPECYKKDMVPKRIYAKIRDLLCQCPLCEIFRRCDNCEKCLLAKADEWCLNKDSAWERWHTSFYYQPDKRKKAAERIVEIVSAWEPEEE
jgi:hypothetical protein